MRAACGTGIDDVTENSEFCSTVFTYYSHRYGHNVIIHAIVQVGIYVSLFMSWLLNISSRIKFPLITVQLRDGRFGSKVGQSDPLLSQTYHPWMTCMSTRLAIIVSKVPFFHHKSVGIISLSL